MVIEIPCEHVWKEISNYIDGEVSVELRDQMDQHFRGCRHCLAVLDGARNIVTLIGDEQQFPLPEGFGERLYSKLRERLR